MAIRVPILSISVSASRRVAKPLRRMVRRVPLSRLGSSICRCHTPWSALQVPLRRRSFGQALPSSLPVWGSVQPHRLNVRPFMGCPLRGIRWLNDAYGRSCPHRGQALGPSGDVHAEHPQQVRDRDEVAAPGAHHGHGELVPTRARWYALVRPMRSTDAAVRRSVVTPRARISPGDHARDRETRAGAGVSDEGMLMAMAFLQLMSGESVAALGRDGRAGSPCRAPLRRRHLAAGTQCRPGPTRRGHAPTGGMSTRLRYQVGSWPGARQAG